MKPEKKLVCCCELANRCSYLGCCFVKLNDNFN